MMEAAGILNSLFAEDPGARRRNLYLRCGLQLAAPWLLQVHQDASNTRGTYPCTLPPNVPLPSLLLLLPSRRFAVIPLTEEAGLVEWVPNTTGLRHCLQEVYAAEGLYVRSTNSTIRKTYDAFTVGGL